MRALVRNVALALAQRPWLLPAGVAVACVLFAALEAEARPGGGHGYSGGGRSGGGRSGGFSGGGYSGGGGGSSSGDGDALFFLIWLCIRHPQIGIPLLVIFGIVVAVKKVRARGQTEWTTAPAPAPYRPSQPRRPIQRITPRGQLAKIRAFDPEFSVVLFEDFLYALYAKVHEARGSGQLELLAPYLSPLVRAELQRRTPGLSDVTTVIVGAMKVVQVHGLEGQGAAQVQVEFEANLTEVANGKTQAYWLSERWTLSRPKSARSRPPDRARVIGCPSCGAPLDAIQGNTCSYCQKQVDTGEFDWKVEGALETRREPRGPQLTGHVEEVGTDLPTIVDREARGRLGELSARDPSFTWPGFEGRVALVFGELNAAWTARDWMRVRPFVSDGLFQTQLYWMETYAKAGLRNVVEQPRITSLELAAVQSDRWFDAVTVRVYARSLDYTVADADPSKPLSGSKTRPRAYSEYWTFLRAVGRQGPARTDKACPNCGAALKVGMAGSCEYCGAKVTTGEFDWVLSRIEQDEEYAG